ncbi:MAG: hypothetical protein HW391_74 [Chloroflexi bacterium]|nr:hypothetical protein [Chloroflexota bacterium]
MSQGLYERYKEALRRGHVASLRGRLDAAAAAYREAAAIAPDRALPHASLGDVLRRLGQADGALAAYGAALDRAPRDETALRGRAEVHAAAGRRVAAALDYERLAAFLDEAGRLIDACDAARRSLELAESRTRRREVERLGALVRDLGGDTQAVAALDRALGVLDVETVVGDTAPTEAPTEAPIEAPTEAALLLEVDAADDQAIDVSPSAPSPSQPDVLRAVADALLDSGDLVGGAERLLQLATLHRSAGRHDAAMDACLALLTIMPSDARLQLEIAAIQVERGWLGAAAEKIRLLGRLTELDGDPAASAAVAAFVVPEAAPGSPQAGA